MLLAQAPPQEILSWALQPRPPPPSVSSNALRLGGVANPSATFNPPRPARRFFVDMTTFLRGSASPEAS
eukprot:5788103-Alexandrium_andersonii.AAC.1